VRPARALVCATQARYIWAPIHRNAKAIMRALLDVILIALELYMYLVLAWVILTWLIAFNIVNTRNPIVSAISDFLFRITEPALRPIRRVIPSLGGIDISPVILFLVIIFLRHVIIYYLYPIVF
jgi:YggT family protein